MCMHSAFHFFLFTLLNHSFFPTAFTAYNHSSIYPNRKQIISPGIDILANPIRTLCAKFLNGKRQMNQKILLSKHLYNSFVHSTNT